MKKSNEISGAELEVMQVLWENNRAMKVQEVCDELKDHDWEYRTVATLLTRMKEKGAVAVSKENKINYYTPVLDRETYKKTQTKTLVQKLYNGSVKDLEADSGMRKLVGNVKNKETVPANAMK